MSTVCLGIILWIDAKDKDAMRAAPLPGAVDEQINLYLQRSIFAD
jgi:hypothetical protein